MDLTWAHKVFLGGYLIPQTPDKITFTHEDRTETIKLASGNSMTIGRKDGPMTVTFDFYVTYEEYPFTFSVNDSSDVKRFEWADIMWEWKQQQTPIKLDIIRPTNTYKDEQKLREMTGDPNLDVVNYWEKYKTRFVTPQAYADVSLTVLLKDWTFEEDANHGSDWKFSITLLQYCPAINQEINFDIEHHLIQDRTAKGWRSGGRWQTPGS